MSRILRQSFTHRSSSLRGWCCAALLGALGSCARTRPEPAARASATTAIAARTTAAPEPSSSGAPNATQPSKRAPPSASAGAPVELSEAEKEAAIRYRAALERGRKATLTKNYDAADSAFSEALSARKDDARALGERGYERLQAGHLDLAADDFLTADGRTHDPVLAAQIFFNQGMLAERQGDLENAKVAYARSQQLHASAAAKKKISELGASSCTAAFVPLAQRLEHYGTWLEFWDTLGEMDHLTSDDAVKKALSVEDCKDICAVNADEWHVVIQTPSGLDVLRAVDRGGFTRCSTYPEFKFERRGSILWISSTNEDYEVALCDDHCKSDDGLCPTCCADGPGHRYDTFVDLTLRSAVLRVSQYGAKGDQFTALPVVLDPQNNVRVSGGGCQRSVLVAGGPKLDVLN